MKKRLFIAMILIMTVIFVSVILANGSGMLKMVDCSIRIGDSVAKLQYPIYMNDNRMYVSLRNICDELEIPIKWDGARREAILDVYNKTVPISDRTAFREEGVIPDEQTALIVGKTILEKYAQKSLEYETSDKTYYLTATLDKHYNGWRVSQTFKFKDKNRGWAVGGGFAVPTVILSRQTGEVLYLNTSSMFSD